MCRVLAITSEFTEFSKEFFIGTSTKARFETGSVKSIIPCPKVADKCVNSRKIICIIYFRGSRWISMLVSKLVEDTKKFSIGIRHLILLTV